jgi:hypothetical protein
MMPSPFLLSVPAFGSKTAILSGPTTVPRNQCDHTPKKTPLFQKHILTLAWNELLFLKGEMAGTIIATMAVVRAISAAISDDGKRRAVFKESSR